MILIGFAVIFDQNTINLGSIWQKTGEKTFTNEIIESIWKFIWEKLSFFESPTKVSVDGIFIESLRVQIRLWFDADQNRVSHINQSRLYNEDFQDILFKKVIFNSESIIKSNIVHPPICGPPPHLWAKTFTLKYRRDGLFCNFRYRK